MSGKGRIVEHLMADASAPACSRDSKGNLVLNKTISNTLCKPSDNNNQDINCAKPLLSNGDDRVGGSTKSGTKCKCPDGQLPKVKETIGTRGRGTTYSYSCP